MRLICLFIFLAFSSPIVSSEILFIERFSEGKSEGWQVSGKGDWLTTTYQGNFSYRLTNQKSATYKLAIGNVSKVTVTISASAFDLEENDQCIGEVSINKGRQWLPVLIFTDGGDDSLSVMTESATIQLESATKELWVRLRANGLNDYTNLIRPRRPDLDLCWFDNIIVSDYR